MTIGSNLVIKAVQAINMPQSVQAQNVYYVISDFQEAQAEEDVVSAVKDWMQALYLTLTNVVVELVELSVMKMYYRTTGTPPQWESFGADDPVAAFVDVGNMLPHGVSLLTRAYTTGTRTIGRKYLCGLADLESEDGVWGATVLAAAAAYNVKWGTTAVIDANNRLNPAVWSAAIEYAKELTDEFVILANAAYQRRRRPGVGS